MDDTDPCGSDNFYDEIASFMPQPGDYTLDDLDEILRSTDSQLDSSLDFSSLIRPSVHDFDVGALDTQQQEAAEYLLQQEAAESLLQQDYKFELSAYPSPASSHQSGCTPSYETPQSQRSTSTSSSDEDSFNPDEFMNFFADDDIKIEEISADVPAIVMDDELPRRRTPSPSGSCSSSGGSSTSGVHSDFSSVVSMSSASTDQMTTFMITDELERSHNAVPAAVTNIVTSTAAAGVPKALPISVLPLQRTAASAPAATIIQPLQQVLIPVKALPITSIQSVGGMKMHTPAPIIKVEPKLAPKVITVQQPAKIVTPVTSATAATTVGGAKITPPPNAKPKTIFLSSKDFKALMQKMNTNGSTAKGAKITGGINGQMPKIIMKTANGKVITANKLVQPLGSNVVTVHQPTQQHHFAPKIVKANGAHVIKHQSQQQPTKAAVSNAIAVAAARAGITSSSTHIVPDLSIYKGMIDDKMFKKQQRMIKNRESASLSRKKKKEYVVSLESRINNLEKENYTLKGENTSLRSQLMAYAQTCQCRHSNISEFILNSLNISTKGHHSSEHNHVKIAPKPAPKSLKQRMTAANVRKNVAVLFAMAFMVTLNVGNFQTYFNKNSIESSIEAAGEAAITATGSAESLGAGRQLLWVESETEFHEKLNRSKREAELEVQPPPLHFLRPLNRTATYGNGTAREPPEPPINCSSNAAGSSNQTEENMRLVNKLHKWIDGNDYLNLSLREKFGNDLDNSVGFKLTPDYLEWNSIELQTGPGGKQKRKFFIQRPQYGNKQRKLDIGVDVDNDKYNGNAIDKGNDNDNGNGNDRNSLELFKPKLSEEYIRLFKGIKRQDDTFYVVSFNTDHILLPASVYNKSARPKMSLMLPAADPSLNGDIVLMQIDCEVVNTTELELKSHMIPEKLRPNKYKNDHPTAEANSTDVANNETRTPDANSQKRSYMPAPVLSKERPPLPRTYFMMGPKTQAAMKKKPTIVKLNGNDSVSHLNALNVKNSTLFAKMRETVEAEESFVNGAN